MGRNFVKNCKKVGIHVHGDFIVGLPGETKETIEKTINFAKDLDCETIQVSLAHAYPGTELYDQGNREGFLAGEAITDDGGHQLPHLEYPGLSKEYMVEAVNRFYDSYYFRPRVAWRIVRDALWDGHERKRLYHEAVGFSWKAACGSSEGSPARAAACRKEGDGCRAASDGPGYRYGSGRRVAERMIVAVRPALQNFDTDSDHGFCGPAGRYIPRQGHEIDSSDGELGARGRVPFFFRGVYFRNDLDWHWSPPRLFRGISSGSLLGGLHLRATRVVDFQLVDRPASSFRSS